MTTPPTLDLLSDLIAKARAAGADSADAVLHHGVSVSVERRLGQIEKLERSEGQDLGLRVFIGQRQAIVSSSDLRPDALTAMVERAVAMARLAPEDPFCGIAAAELLAQDYPILDNFDPVEPDIDTLLARAAAAEDTALAYQGVTNSDGASAGWGSGYSALVTSAGFAGENRSTWHSISMTAVAGSGTGMERDYDYTSALFAEDLDDPVVIGRTAAERAVRRLNPRKLDTAKVPVIFDPRVAGGLVGHALGAISGPSIARGTSFLKDKLGQAVFSDAITLREDPHRRRGLRSRPYDAEGLPTQARALFDKGVLTTWLLDLRSARQLNLAPTGHAARGTSGPPGPSASNLIVEPGSRSPQDLYAGENALYVTDLMGQGVNGLTGDYSRGAAGFWIEKGEIAYPVSEITIAGNLKDMYRAITPANDLELKRGIDSPTLRVDGMTLAGR